MFSAATSRQHLLQILCLYHLMMTLDAGYFMNKLYQQPQYLPSSLYTQQGATASGSLIYNYAMGQDRSSTLNQQNLEGHPVKQYFQKHLKCAHHPNGETRQLTFRGRDFITFVDDRNTTTSTFKPEELNAPANNVAEKTLSKPQFEIPKVESVHNSTDKETTTKSMDPSRCVWAIISCCSPGSSNVRHHCFEILGCPGPFWDTSPCNEGMTGAAVKVAGNFYSGAQEI